MNTEDSVPLFFRHLAQGFVVQDSGLVHLDIDAPEWLDSGLDHLLPLHVADRTLVSYPH